MKTRFKSLDDIDAQAFRIQEQFRLPDRNWNPKYIVRRSILRGIWMRYTLNIRRFFSVSGPQITPSEHRKKKLPSTIYSAPIAVDENGHTDSPLNHPVSIN